MDVSAWKVPLFLAAGVVAGFLNTVAGGGSFVAFPLLVLFGYPAHVANGTLRITIVLQNLVAVPAYAREGYFFPKESLVCSLVAVPAAVLGALAAVHLDPESFRLVSAVLVLLVLGTLFVHPDRWTRSDPVARIRWARAMPLFAAVGFYGGFFQLGVGMPFLAVAVLAAGWDLVTANSIKVTVILLFTAVSLAVFATHDQVAWAPGLLLGVGSMAGAWLGARSAVTHGPGWIRWIMVAIAVVAAARLLAA